MIDQAQLVSGLLSPEAYPHPVGKVEHLETHISHVLLAGEYAYKIKKPLDLGFLDFSTLEKRHFCCEEELRLNRRLAPDLYLEVTPVTGTQERPCMGGSGEVQEYAVRMRRFPQDALLSRREVSVALIDRIAERVAEFHQSIPSVRHDSPFGEPEAVFFPMQQNFDQIRQFLADPAALGRLDPLERWTRETFERLRPNLETRRKEGHIRECHGDMHLGNIALIGSELVIFDGIEFNPSLRWIDTTNEVAFFVMDLEQAGRQDLARGFLNRYLELSGDYEGLAVLDFYKVYRALVRAKVTAIRFAQSGLGEAERRVVAAEYDRYVGLAESYTRFRRPRLFITYGVSGSGKSALIRLLRQHLPLIQVRSDVERKRQFGLAERERSGSEAYGGIYTEEATRRTYEHLRRLADEILGAGYDPCIDATFLKAWQRQLFVSLARERGCAFSILVPEAPDEVLRVRVRERLAQARDASEADLGILESQLRRREPLSGHEAAAALVVDTVNPPEPAELVARLSA
jgi:uncharacterized protein